MRTMITLVNYILNYWKAVRIHPLKSGYVPVTTEPTIPPLIRAQIEGVHNSVVGHFGVEYTRKALQISRGVNDKRLRRFVAKFVRDCPVCQLRSAMNRQIMTHHFTTAS
jgi:hypothetical protein